MRDAWRIFAASSAQVKFVVDPTPLDSDEDVGDLARQQHGLAAAAANEERSEGLVAECEQDRSAPGCDIVYAQLDNVAPVVGWTCDPELFDERGRAGLDYAGGRCERPAGKCVGVVVGRLRRKARLP